MRSTNSITVCGHRESDQKEIIMKEKTRKWLWLGHLFTITLLALTVLPIHAGLINSETGEYYRPEFDEDGNLEEPPDWVDTGDQGEEPFESEVLSEEDICDSDVGLFTCSDQPMSVSTALGFANARASLFAALIEILDGVMDTFEFVDTDKDGNVTASQVFDPPIIQQFECNDCDYTYIQCLLDGRGVDWCKKHTLNCQTGNDVTFTVPASGTTTILGAPVTVSGSVTIEGHLAVREITTKNGGTRLVVCIYVDSFTVNGFGVAQGYVQNQLNTLLAQQGGAFCSTIDICE
jgi:hypothetical protein